MPSSLAVSTIAFVAMTVSLLAMVLRDHDALPKTRTLGRYCSVLLIVLPRISPQVPPPHFAEMAAQVISESVDASFASLHNGSDAIGVEGTKEESSRKDQNDSPSLELPPGLLASAIRYSSQSFRNISASSDSSYVTLASYAELDDPRERAPPTTRS